MNVSEQLRDAVAAWKAERTDEHLAQAVQLLTRLAKAGVRAFRKLSPMDREDIVQEAVWAVWQKIAASEVDPGKEAAYIMTAVRNRSINTNHRRQREELDEALEAEAPEERRPDTVAENRELLERLPEAIDALPDSPRWVFAQVVMRHRSQAEVAEERFEKLHGSEALDEARRERLLKNARNWVDVNLRRARIELMRWVEEQS